MADKQNWWESAAKGIGASLVNRAIKEIENNDEKVSTATNNDVVTQRPVDAGYGVTRAVSEGNAVRDYSMRVINSPLFIISVGVLGAAVIIKSLKG